MQNRRFNEAPVNSPGKARSSLRVDCLKPSFNEAPVNSPGKGDDPAGETPAPAGFNEAPVNSPGKGLSGKDLEKLLVASMRPR